MLTLYNRIFLKLNTVIVCPQTAQYVSHLEQGHNLRSYGRMRSAIKMYAAAVAYAENFHGGVSFSGRWWSFVFVVRCL